MTKDQQRHHHINVLRAPDSARQAVPVSARQAAALVVLEEHARGARFSAAKYAGFALKKT
ncbi:MAG: hypothetical protein WCK54_04625 [Desulfuromonadales bacterium]